MKPFTHTVSPFLVEKAITKTVGEVKSTKKLRSGDLLVEIQSRKQSQQIVKLKKISTIPITVSPHASLNSSKGVITCGEWLNVPTEEILKELQGQGGYGPQPIAKSILFENNFKLTKMDKLEYQAIEQLDASNYNSWCDDVRVILLEKDCRYIVQGTETPPAEGATAKEVRDYRF
ncbi:hypothetical protein AVEN_1956-1 [Araneus ventricosus]|uniref:Uncharacterized protein n=1 Tax=Araneus ventricosus TaxID=182803 RepID=A0A4Y2PJD3_ARAVE|nr:hypothetical protein AVEN_1956-1 [Araneus ventricosus]